jgi:hypothetical protein
VATSDDYWRRPPEGTEEPPRSPVTPPTAAYSGPPRSSPPPHGWRPPMVFQPAPPRAMPKQDEERLDREEQAATILTKGVGIFAGAVLVVLLLILCGRVLF